LFRYSDCETSGFFEDEDDDEHEDEDEDEAPRLIMIPALKKEDLIFIDSIYQPMLLRNTPRPCVRSL
jgi:hypothetical protein